MKVAIPVDNNSMESSICMSFGRAPFFFIYDTETEDKKFIENRASASQGGAGIKAAQILVDSGAEAVIAPRCGENAAQVIKAADLKLYKNFNNSITDNIEALKKDQLDLLRDIHPGFHQHGRM